MRYMGLLLLFVALSAKAECVSDQDIRGFGAFQLGAQRSQILALYESSENDFGMISFVDAGMVVHQYDNSDELNYVAVLSPIADCASAPSVLRSLFVAAYGPPCSEHEDRLMWQDTDGDVLILSPMGGFTFQTVESYLAQEFQAFVGANK